MACKSVAHFANPWTRALPLSLIYGASIALPLLRPAKLNLVLGPCTAKPSYLIVTYLLLVLSLLWREESLAQSQGSEYICCWMYKWRIEYECGFNFLCRPGCLLWNIFCLVHVFKNMIPRADSNIMDCQAKQRWYFWRVLGSLYFTVKSIIYLFVSELFYNALFKKGENLNLFFFFFNPNSDGINIDILPGCPIWSCKPPVINIPYFLPYFLLLTTHH